MNNAVKALRRALGSMCNPSHNKELFVADLVFVVLTVALFAALTVLIKAAER
ncbi:hypothetical protein OHA21_20030 [Actinoplanes sp. NBC_00393]|uniref:hypothetical protein n=1 Tax=Actinoplanes sp. NBC_00393 TaxID=2975953 RepID=UPI002E1D1DAF